VARANFLWGERRIQGELLKLAIIISQTTVSRYTLVSHVGHRRRSDQARRLQQLLLSRW
jgi:hypothetical protein